MFSNDMFSGINFFLTIGIIVTYLFGLAIAGGLLWLLWRGIVSVLA